MEKYDVVIVGACTAGTYFSSLLAKGGLKVLVIDKDTEENLCKRLDIIHFTRDSYKQFNIDESKQGDEEFVRNFEECISKSALDNHPKKSFTKVSVLHLPLFIKRLRNKAIENGANFMFNQSFDYLTYDENGKIDGLVTKQGLEIKARLVVDASGIPSVVRRSLNDPFMETFEIGPRDMFYVLLKYVKLKDENAEVALSTSWPYYKGWIAPQHTKGGAIVGVGANLSVEYARKCMDKFESSIPLPEYTLQYEEIGCTPYRRPPFSFVTDNFLVIGDAACLTKPWNGEGIPCCWVLATPAAKIVIDALKDYGVASKEALWKINELYQKGEGATYASTRAMLIGAVNMSKSDNDYMFKHSIVFKGDDEKENTKVVSTLLKGVFKGEFKFKSLLGLISAVSKGSKLEKHYKNYPNSPEGYIKWVKKAEKLWNKAGSMADCIKDA